MYYSSNLYREDLEIAYNSITDVEKLFQKNILVTGVTGLIGGFLIDELFWMNENKNANIEIYCLGRDYDRIALRFQSHLNDKMFHIITQDVTNSIIIDTNIDYIVHAAGDGYPEAFKERPVETMLPAFIGTYQLLQMARKCKNPKFLYVSSGEVYGKNVSFERAFNESDIGSVDSMSVRSCYPIAKKAAETLCVSFNQEYGVKSVIARLGHIYGATTNVKDNRATVQFLQNAVNNVNICMYSKGIQLRSYTYVADCVAGLLTILTKGKSSEVYNVANTKSSVSVVEFAEMLSIEAGVGIEIHEPNNEQIKQLTPIEYAVLDSRKLEMLGWTNKYSIQKGINHMYRIAKEMSNN